MTRPGRPALDGPGERGQLAGRARPAAAGLRAPPPGVPAAARPAPSRGHPRPAGRRPRWGRIFLVGGWPCWRWSPGSGCVTSYLWVKGVDDGLKRTDPFAAARRGRPQKLADGTLNILLLGSRLARPGRPVERRAQWRTDTIVIMHIPASHDQAYLISIPRDLWVHVPESPDGQNGDTMAKINAAYAWGGLPLMVQTVEEYTGVRMDHVALIDFAGFVKVTDALGGVDMNVDQTITSIHQPYRQSSRRARTTSTAPRRWTTCASATSSPTATSPACATSRSS